MRWLAFASGCVVVLGATVATAADPSSGKHPPLDYRYDSVTAATAPKQVKVRADCRRGTQVAGGGFGPNMASAPPSSVAPADGPDKGKRADDAWLIDTNTESSGEPIVSLATCTKDAAVYVRSTPKRVGAGNAASSVATCPQQTSVSGGGVKAGGPASAILLNSSHPVDGPDNGKKPDDGWRVRVYNQSAISRAFRAHAICLPARLAYRSEKQSLDPGSGSSSFVDCPQGRPAVSAGTQLSGPAVTGRVEAFYTYDSNSDADTAPDDQAYAFGSNAPSAPDPKRLRVFAICR